LLGEGWKVCQATIVRNPIDRACSWYAYVCARPWHHLHARVIDQRLTLINCLDQGLTVELDNFMTRSLSHERFVDVPFGQITPEMVALANEHLREMSVLVTETLDEDARALVASWGLRQRAVPKLNVSPIRDDERELSPETRRAIERHHEHDMMLYELAKQLRVGLGSR